MKTKEELQYWLLQREIKREERFRMVEGIVYFLLFLMALPVIGLMIIIHFFL